LNGKNGGGYFGIDWRFKIRFFLVRNEKSLLIVLGTEKIEAVKPRRSSWVWPQRTISAIICAKSAKSQGLANMRPFIKIFVGECLAKPGSGYHLSL
jgi:hypothetical protein